MDDLRAQLKGIETASPPDLWAGIEERVMEEVPDVDANVSSFEGFRTRRQEVRRRLAAGLVAAAVVAAVAVVAWRSFQTAPTKAPIGTEQLPSGWERCTNDVVGYSIGFPGDWHTTHVFDGEADLANACRWFSAEPFGPRGNVVAEGWGYPLEVAMGGTIDQELLDLRALEARILQEEPAVIDGHPAVRLEYETESDPVADPGRHYQYVIELDEETSLIVHTTDTRGIVGDYERNRTVVDIAAESVRFTKS